MTDRFKVSFFTTDGIVEFRSNGEARVPKLENAVQVALDQGIPDWADKMLVERVSE